MLTITDDDSWSETLQMVHGGRAQAAHIWIDEEKWSAKLTSNQNFSQSYILNNPTGG